MKYLLCHGQKTVTKAHLVNVKNKLDLYEFWDFFLAEIRTRGDVRTAGFFAQGNGEQFEIVRYSDLKPVRYDASEIPKLIKKLRKGA